MFLRKVSKQIEQKQIFVYAFIYISLRGHLMFFYSPI